MYIRVRFINVDPINFMYQLEQIYNYCNGSDLYIFCRYVNRKYILLFDTFTKLWNNFRQRKVVTHIICYEQEYIECMCTHCLNVE